MRLVAEAEVAKNERDDGRRMEAEALEQEWIAKCRAEKSRVATWTAEEKVHKYSIALITPWLMIELYFVVTTVSGGNGHRQLCLPWVCIFTSENICMPYYLLPDMFYVAIIDNALDMCILCWLVHID